jgi:opacity protein-like surface antigen
MKNAFRTVVVSCLGLAALASAGAASAQSYWRLDTGYSKSLQAQLKDVGPSTLGCGDRVCSNGMTFDNVGHSLIIGLGWGYRFGTYFRSDITFDVRDGYRLDSTDKRIPPSDFHADIKSKALMLNAYIDFPSSSVARPYIGIGVGAAANKVGDVTVNNYQGVAGATAVALGGKKTAAAGAFMVGFSVPTADGGAVEIGFRYVSLGKLHTDAGELAVTTGGVTTFGSYDGLTGRVRATEWTVGIRF